MGASVTVTSGNGAAGAVLDFTITDTTTPTSMANQTNEVPSIEMHLDPVTNTDLLNQNSITVSNPDIGNFYAIVDGVDDAKPVDVQAVGILGPLNAEIAAPPVGSPSTLSVAYTIYINLAYKTPPTIVYSATNNPVVNYPAFGGSGQGTLWEFLKQLGTVTHTQIVEVNNTIVIQDMPTTATNRLLPMTEFVGDEPERAISTPTLTQFCTITQTNPKTVSSFPGTLYNYSTNPSVETNATGWSATTAAPTGGTLTASGRSTTQHANGSASFQMTCTEGILNLFGLYDHLVQVSPTQTVPVGAIPTGTAIYVSMALRAPAFPGGAGSTGISTSIQLQWVDGGSNVLKTTTASGPAGVSNSFVTATISDTVPLNAVNCIVTGTINYSYTNSSLTPLTGVLFYADSLLFTNGGTMAYWDGSSGGASWVGATNNSVSQQTSTTTGAAFYDAYVDNNTIYGIASGQTATFLAESTNYPTQIQQPTYSLTGYPGIGNYLVSDSTGLILTASQWLSAAPNPIVATTSVPGELSITLTGPIVDIPGTVGPYTLSGNYGSGGIAAFSVAGIGMLTTPTTLTLFTGADATQTQNIQPVDLSSPFIQNSTDAFTVYADAMPDLTGPQIVTTFTLPESQALGLGSTPGALAKWKYNIYRASSASVVDGNTTVTALPYLKDTDFDAVWGNSGSILDTAFDATWGTGVFNSNDFQVKPLWR